MIDRLTRNQLVRLSVDERLSERLRREIRVELGDTWTIPASQWMKEPSVKLVDEFVAIPRGEE